MTPKEKAWELMDKCTRYHRNGIYNVVHEDIAKQYALIVVDELIEHSYKVMKPFWEEVKLELNKL